MVQPLVPTTPDERFVTFPAGKRLRLGYNSSAPPETGGSQKTRLRESRGFDGRIPCSASTCSNDQEVHGNGEASMSWGSVCGSPTPDGRRVGYAAAAAWTVVQLASSHTRRHWQPRGRSAEDPSVEIRACEPNKSSSTKGVSVVRRVRLRLVARRGRAWTACSTCQPVGGGAALERRKGLRGTRLKLLPDIALLCCILLRRWIPRFPTTTRRRVLLFTHGPSLHCRFSPCDLWGRRKGTTHPRRPLPRAGAMTFVDPEAEILRHRSSKFLSSSLQMCAKPIPTSRTSKMKHLGWRKPP